jgi:hypothetical protein
MIEVSGDAPQLPLATMTELGNTAPPKATIGTLPDVALLEIFDFFVATVDLGHIRWYRLVHVCRRWRYVIFASPRRLNLQLFCTSRTPVKKMLDIWPVLPLKISSSVHRLTRRGANGVDNILAALGHRDRVGSIDLSDLTSSPLKRLVAVMREPFPALTYLKLSSSPKRTLVLPDSFMGGSVPRLRELRLYAIPFPEVPKLLLSAHDLVTITFFDIPHSGYFSPEAMVTGLSALTRLKYLDIEFLSPRSHPDPASRRPPLQTRIVLPALADFQFRGVCEYLEDLVARTHAPLLKRAHITFFNQLVFDTFQFSQFIGRVEKFRTLNQAKVVFYHVSVMITLSPQRDSIRTTDYPFLDLEISCRQLDWQLSSLAQICSPFLPSISILQHLDIREGQYWRPLGKDDMENNQYLEFLHPFTSAENLYLSQNPVIRIAPTLQELAGHRVTDVFPALQNLFLNGPKQSGPVREAARQFASALQLSGHPVAVHIGTRGA